MQYDAALEPAPVPAPAAPWTLRDMLKAVGIMILGMLAVTVPAALIASAVADLGHAEDARSPLSCSLSICVRRVNVNLTLEDIPSALTAILAASFFMELLFLGTAVHFSVRKYRLPFAALGLRMPERAGWWLPGALVMGGLGIVYIYFTVLAAFGVEPDSDIPEEAFNNLAPAVTLGLLSLVFAPLMEEVFFRGFIFGGLRGRWGVLGAALGSGFLFALAHIGNPGTLYVIPPIGLVGALFAWGYVYSGSILPGMIAHLLFNLVSFSVGLATS